MSRWLSFFLVTLLLVGGYGQAQEPDYVTDQVCLGCHATGILDAPIIDEDAYMGSGHPWKIFQTAGEVPAANTWPHTPVPPLPTIGTSDDPPLPGAQLDWSAVEYVIGNFFWKARFIDPAGFIYTGTATDKTQWNLAIEGGTQEFVPYHAGEVGKPFDCGRCHTTGYDPAGNQNNLPGLVGTWVQDGVRCEACHGPGMDHVTTIGQTPMPGGKDCSECHYRDEQFRMPWKGGFMRHHQQAEDLSHSPHTFLSCETCHNPHRSTVYKDGGTIKHCSDCHDGDEENNFYEVPGMESVDCIECHMPDMGKSALAVNPYKGDVRGHLFRIMTDPVAAADNVTDGFWNQNPDGSAAITLDYACLGCHTDMTLQAASAFAKTVHKPVTETYLGDDACAVCHQEKYDSYIRSGHPWKLYETNRQQPAADAFPWDVPLPELPDGVGWEDVDYIFGNFSSGHGYVVGTNDQGVDGIVLNRGFPYSNCVKCHVTGYDPQGGVTNGVLGTWAQSGVRCEACHSQQGPHDDSLEGAKDCTDCHYGGTDVDRIDFTPAGPDDEGFGEWGHHPQAEMFIRSPHQNGTCSSCHDPHKSTFFDDGGVAKHCTDCHDEAEHTLPEGMAHLDCTDCHMAADHSHIFRITHDPIAAADNVHVDPSDGKTYWNVEDGNAFLTLDLVCLECHSEAGEAGPLTLAEAAEAANGIHVPPAPPAPAGDTWYLGGTNGDMMVTFTPFVGILNWVEILYPDGTTVSGIGYEVNGFVYFYGFNFPSYTIFYGWINRDAGTVWGILINQNGVSIAQGSQM